MAISDIGMFSPSRSNYSTPGAWEEMLRGEALKRASYLSQMDEFYTQLAESERQFNETLLFKQSESEVQQEQFGQSLDLEKQRLAEQKREHEEEMKVKKQELVNSQPMITLGRDPYKVSEQDQFDFLKDQVGGYSLPGSISYYDSNRKTGSTSSSYNANDLLNISGGSFPVVKEAVKNPSPTTYLGSTLYRPSDYNINDLSDSEINPLYK